MCTLPPKLDKNSFLYIVLSLAEGQRTARLAIASQRRDGMGFQPLRVILVILSPILAPMSVVAFGIGFLFLSLVGQALPFYLIVETYTKFPFWVATGYTIIGAAITAVTCLLGFGVHGVIVTVFEDNEGLFWFIGIGFWFVLFLSQLHSTP